MIKNYKCLTTLHPFYFVNIKEYIQSKDYILCNYSIELDSVSKSFLLNICLKKCLKDCNSFKYILRAKYSEVINSTKLTVIPLKTPHIKQIETFNKDFNQLIYELGGNMGLWFGISALNISNLFVSIIKILQNISTYIIILKNILQLIYSKITLLIIQFLVIINYLLKLIKYTFKKMLFIIIEILYSIFKLVKELYVKTQILIERTQ